MRAQRLVVVGIFIVAIAVLVALPALMRGASEEQTEVVEVSRPSDDVREKESSGSEGGAKRERAGHQPDPRERGGAGGNGRGGDMSAGEPEGGDDGIAAPPRGA